MTCTRVGNAIICTSEAWGRLRVGRRYVWVDWHPYTGPTFFSDAGMTKVYDPDGENDPVWPPFSKWLEKHKKGEAKP